MSLPRLINMIHRGTSVKKFRALLQTTPLSSLNTVITRNCFVDKFDPPYLDSMKPKTPVYDTVNVQMKGHDFAVLENYQKLVYQIAKIMDLDVEDGWATPAQIMKAQTYKPQSTNVDAQYILPIFERNIQIVDLPSASVSIFLEMIQTALPQGVTLSVHEHDPQHDEIRYVPDYKLEELKTQLTNFEALKKKNKF